MENSMKQPETKTWHVTARMRRVSVMRVEAETREQAKRIAMQLLDEAEVVDSGTEYSAVPITTYW